MRVEELEVEGESISANTEGIETIVDDMNNDFDDDEEHVSVLLGFVEKPRDSRSLLRESFPCKAGGVPVRLHL